MLLKMSISDQVELDLKFCGSQRCLYDSADRRPKDFRQSMSTVEASAVGMTYSVTLSSNKVSAV
jgi:hypothetical protein